MRQEQSSLLPPGDDGFPEILYFFKEDFFFLNVSCKDAYYGERSPFLCLMIPLMTKVFGKLSGGDSNLAESTSYWARTQRN